jgi:hypothetical protein
MSEHVLRLSKADDEDERDKIYEGIYEVAEVCPHLSADIVNRYNNHERLVKALAKMHAIAEFRESRNHEVIAAGELLATMEAEKGGEL